MLDSKKPVILLGHGAREEPELAGAVVDLGVPVLTSWQAKDLVDNNHPMYFGSPGIYGNRVANKILYNATEILSIGNRMSIWNVGFEGPRKDQVVNMVDCDEAEIDKFPHAESAGTSCKDFLWRIPKQTEDISSWVRQCEKWRKLYPWVESPTHDDTGYIHSHRFVDFLQPYFSEDEVIVTEMGAALISAHQVLRMKPPQRLMTSGGLGEMGCGLPAAIGASFARNKGRVICLSTDGGMMFNLQELQTIVHHKLPVKIIVFNNSGYGMLKQTQENAGMESSGVDSDSGVSFPNFRHVALAFGITASEVRTWEDFERIIPGLFFHDGPQLVDYIMDPKQRYYPKLGYKVVGGKQVYNRFDQMSPEIYA